MWAGGGGGVVFGILPVNKCVHFWRLAELIIERVRESKIANFSGFSFMLIFLIF